ncbi:hypothetical protein AC578_1594 [Pseudocercospora eumusae]|uniref:Uncharacterized protein n=1 Tax=Pseudocercospora eumusae TaxID=321146 RepID=A0A139HLW6_9PEZI|nr:hypothetical protein AC578_1594 [Pseudocercospora eumusae]
MARFWKRMKEMFSTDSPTPTDLRNDQVDGAQQSLTMYYRAQDEESSDWKSKSFGSIQMVYVVHVQQVLDSCDDRGTAAYEVDGRRRTPGEITDRIRTMMRDRSRVNELYVVVHKIIRRDGRNFIR